MPNQPCEWSVITVAFNSAKPLREFWADFEPDTGAERIVVDNASTDGSAELATDLGATQVIALSTNVGFAAANNIGAERSAGKFVAFVNPDVRVTVESLATLAKHLDEFDHIVAPQLIYRDGSLQPNGRGLPFLWSKMRSLIQRTDHLPGYHLYATEEDLEVAWAIGAAVCMRRSTFERIGGWDSSFFVYYEDSELGLRARVHGVPTVIIAGVRWVHGWARETRSMKTAAWKLEARSAWRFYRRYPALLFPNRRAGRHKLLGEEL